MYCVGSAVGENIMPGRGGREGELLRERRGIDDIDVVTAAVLALVASAKRSATGAYVQRTVIHRGVSKVWVCMVGDRASYAAVMQIKC